MRGRRAESDHHLHHHHHHHEDSGERPSRWASFLRSAAATATATATAAATVAAAARPRSHSQSPGHTHGHGHGHGHGRAAAPFNAHACCAACEVVHLARASALLAGAAAAAAEPPPARGGVGRGGDAFLLRLAATQVSEECVVYDQTLSFASHHSLLPYAIDAGIHGVRLWKGAERRRVRQQQR